MATHAPKAHHAPDDLTPGKSSSVPGELGTNRPARGGSSNDASKWLGKRMGKFRLVALLGRGSWGKVFEAEDTTLRRRVALKLLPAPTAEQAEGGIERLASEARAAAALDHAHVVQVYEAGRHKKLFYIAMELAEGGSIADLLSAGPLEPHRAASLCAEAAAALGAAHEVGIIHRDVKPANLMLTRAGRCKVADFGLAAGGSASDPLHASRAAGTPHYIAPEIVRGATADARSDVYSLGATLYHMLAGRRPFQDAALGSSASQSLRSRIMQAQIEREMPDVRLAAPGTPEGLVEIIRRATLKNPADRYPDARAMEKALRHFTIPGGTSPTRVEPTKTTEGPLKSPLVIGGAIAAAVAVFIIGGLLVTRSSEIDAPPHVAPPALAAVEPEPTVEASPAVAPEEPQVMVDHTFTLDTDGWLEQPRTVHVAGDFNGWSATATPLTDPDGDRTWQTDLRLAEGKHLYKFVINGGQRWIPDPAADQTLEENDNMNGRNSGVILRREQGSPQKP
jgi:serine/threonine-protein kinase